MFSPLCHEKTSLHEGLGRRPISLHAITDEGSPSCGYDPAGPSARHRRGDVDSSGPVSCNVVLVMDVLVGAVHDQAGSFGGVAKLG